MKFSEFINNSGSKTGAFLTAGAFSGIGVVAGYNFLDGFFTHTYSVVFNGECECI